MSSSVACATCGTPVASVAAGPHCPACLLRSVLELNEAEPETSGDDFPREFGGYELLAEVGRGGMGLVFKARQRSLGRLVALKVLLSGRYADDVSRRRFRFEAEAAAQLQHPNIVTVHEVGECEGQPYLTMDWIDGPNLAEHGRDRALSPHNAARIIRDLAGAIEAAHARGVLHRDIKPSNVLIGPDRRPRLTDFGIAKWAGAGPDLTLPGQLVGSPNYASPEQVAGGSGAGSTASDVYGLGAVLYYLLTGAPPHAGATAADTIRQVLESEPVRPRALNAAVPRDLEIVCLRCLERVPARRYESAAALGQELDRFLRDEPILARPISAAEATWRWCRRRPALAALGAITGVALVVTAVVSTMAARRIGRAEVAERAGRLAAEASLYASDMQVIGAGFQSALGAHPRDTASRLEPWRPAVRGRDLRGFEWRYFWTLNRGDPRGTFRGHRHMIDRAFVAPDGRHVATLSRDGVAKVWTAGEQREIASVPDVAALGGFSPEGAALVFARPDGAVAEVRLDTGITTPLGSVSGRLLAWLGNAAGAVILGPDELPVVQPITSRAPTTVANVPPTTVAAVAAGGAHAAVAGPRHPGILVLDLKSGQRRAVLPERRPIITLALSPDGRWLVAGGFDAVLKVWDVERGAVAREFRPFFDPMWASAFSPDGRRFAAGGHNREIKVWNAATWELEETFSGHESTVLALAFSADGTRLVSAGEDELAFV